MNKEKHERIRDSEKDEALKSWEGFRMDGPYKPYKPYKPYRPYKMSE